jgi:hypothetical protein
MDMASRGVDSAKEAGSKAADKGHEMKESAKDMASKGVDSAKKAGSKAADKGHEMKESAKQKGHEVAHKGHGNIHLKLLG